MKTAEQIADSMFPECVGFSIREAIIEAVNRAREGLVEPPETVWMIERGDFDEDNHRRWTTMEDRGFFLTEEDAGEYISRISDSCFDFTTIELDRNDLV